MKREDFVKAVSSLDELLRVTGFDWDVLELRRYRLLLVGSFYLEVEVSSSSWYKLSMDSGGCSGVSTMVRVDGNTIEEAWKQFSTNFREWFGFVNSHARPTPTMKGEGDYAIGRLSAHKK
jgi:hypothetical protein